MAIVEAGDREKVCVVSTYTPPRHKADEEGGEKERARVSIKTPGGESFTPASESIVLQYSHSSTPV